ncbi:hypothetical protein [Heliobacterium mobile]|nr:hypothetical protein [Heliobacterium mobile]
MDEAYPLDIYGVIQKEAAHWMNFSLQAVSDHVQSKAVVHLST